MPASVQAGLRTGNMAEPFPEEMNRVLTGRIASLHCAATEQAAGNLAREQVDPRSVIVTGNTGIDALFHVVRAIREGRIVPRTADFRALKDAPCIGRPGSMKEQGSFYLHPCRTLLFIA